METEQIVTIRIKIADSELEVTGPKTWAEKMVEKLICSKIGGNVDASNWHKSRG